MDRGAWQATVHRFPRARHNLATKQQQQVIYTAVHISGGIHNHAGHWTGGTSCLEFEETFSPPHHGVKLAETWKPPCTHPRASSWEMLSLWQLRQELGISLWHLRWELLACWPSLALDWIFTELSSRYSTGSTELNVWQESGVTISNWKQAVVCGFPKWFLKSHQCLKYLSVFPSRGEDKCWKIRCYFHISQHAIRNS